MQIQDPETDQPFEISLRHPAQLIVLQKQAVQLVQTLQYTLLDRRQLIVLEMKPGQFWHLTKRATLHAGNLIVVQPEEQQRRGQSRERIFTYRSDVVVPQIQPHQV